MIGFGVLAAFFSPGVVYNTPDLSGFQLAVGAYDPSPLPGFYDATRWVSTRERGSPTTIVAVSFDFTLFGNGNVSEILPGRFETPLPLDMALGMAHESRSDPCTWGWPGIMARASAWNMRSKQGDALPVSSKALSYSNFSGYSALQAKLKVGPFDLNGGWGLSKRY